jgi:hypothetical protein
MTYVANSCTILQSDVKGKLSSSFEPLTSLGFLSEALSKIESQVDKLIESHNSIVAEISSHMQVVEAQEDGLDNGYQSGTFTGGYGGTSSGGSTSSWSSDGSPTSTVDESYVEPQITEAAEYELVEESDGLKVNADEFIEMLSSIGGEYQTTLINLINSNKPSDVSLIDLLLDNSNSAALYKTLKDVFGDSLDMSSFTLEDYEKVQKHLLNMIVKSDVSIPKLSDNTILAGKTYLVKVCSDNKIEPSDLFFNDKYKGLLKTSLLEIYDGSVGDAMTDKEIRNFRYEVDVKAKKNNMSSEELIENHLELLI